MSEHTKEPWFWLPDEGQFIVTADRAIVAEVPCQGANPEDGRRIVACVNACEGILTDDLARLMAENELLRKLLKLSQSGRHIHVAHDPDRDTCASCGQNFRSEVHFRDGESKKTDDALITAALKG